MPSRGASLELPHRLIDIIVANDDLPKAVLSTRRPWYFALRDARGGTIKDRVGERLFPRRRGRPIHQLRHFQGSRRARSRGCVNLSLPRALSLCHDNDRYAQEPTSLLRWSRRPTAFPLFLPRDRGCAPAAPTQTACSGHGRAARERFTVGKARAGFDHAWHRRFNDLRVARIATDARADGSVLSRSALEPAEGSARSPVGAHRVRHPAFRHDRGASSRFGAPDRLQFIHLRLTLRAAEPVSRPESREIAERTLTMSSAMSASDPYHLQQYGPLWAHRSQSASSQPHFYAGRAARGSHFLTQRYGGLEPCSFFASPPRPLALVHSASANGSRSKSRTSPDRECASGIGAASARDDHCVRIHVAVPAAS